MDINFERYKIFYFVAKSKSVTKTAEKLFVSQPAITQNIRKLESELGGKLFYKTSKRIELKEEGKNLYNYIESSVEILTNAEEKFKQNANMESGTIRIRTGGTVAKIVLYEPLKRFMKKYPNINVEITRGSHKESLRMLNNGEIDLMIINIPNEISMQNIEVISLVEKEYAFVMSKLYKEKNKVNINSIEDLNKYDLIASTNGTTYRNILEKNLVDHEKLNIKYQVMMESFKKELVLEDIGIAFMLKDELKDEIEQGTVEVIDILSNKVKSEIDVAVLKNDLRSFATQKLLEIIKDYLNEGV